MSRFAICDLPLAGLKRVVREKRGDSRGFLSRLFCADDLSAAGWRKPVSQINQTVTSRRGTVRGLHFQGPPHAEIKLVSCLRGAVWDVAVDLRSGSPTFLAWHAEELSAENGAALLIPEGFAHGFQALTDECELLYLHSAPYAPLAEGGINPRDPAVGVAWPLPISELSPRDEGHPMLTDRFTGVLP